MLQTKNMQTYSDFVEALARDRQDKVFFNSGPNHAAIVMSRIFKYAQHSVKIFCGGFSGTISNDPEYLFYLEDFLKRKGNLTVLAERDLRQTNARIFPVLKQYADQVSLYVTGLKVTNEENKKPIHFTIGDASMLRLETDVEDFTAQVNFGDNNSANNFLSIFEEIRIHPQSHLINLS